MNEKFYVYVYLDPRKKANYKYGSYVFDYEPFYIGKGKESRCMRHLNEFLLEKDKNKLKTNKIKKIIRETGKEPLIIKIKENLLEEDSLILETNMIKLIGRLDLKLGVLTNLTDGGEGTSGHVMSDKQKQDIRERQTGKIPSEQTTTKMSLTHKKR